MISVGSRVRHIDPTIDRQRGVMIVIGIKNSIAICGYDDFDKAGEIHEFHISKLKLD